jgi:hypothetical protein
MAMVMVVTAMLIMVMVTVVVLMTVIVVMIVTTMIMFGMIVARMAMRFVRVAVAGISATFGVERRLNLDDTRAQAPHHRLDDVIAPDPQTVSRDLRRQMAVTKMPSNPDEVPRVLTTNFKQRFRRRYDFHQPAVIEHQRITAA